MLNTRNSLCQCYTCTLAAYCCAGTQNKQSVRTMLLDYEAARLVLDSMCPVRGLQRVRKVSDNKGRLAVASTFACTHSHCDYKTCLVAWEGTRR